MSFMYIPPPILIDLNVTVTSGTIPRITYHSLALTKNELTRYIKMTTFGQIRRQHISYQN